MGNLFRQIDLNHDGEISIEELKIALKDEKSLPSIKELANIMESIDTDKNGRINYNEFLASCMDSTKLFTEEHIRQLFKKIDTDGNGYVERKELLDLLTSTPFSTLGNGMSSLNGKSVD